MAGMCGLVGGGGGAAGALGTMFAAMADYGGASASWSGRGWNFGLRRRAEAAAPQPGVGGFAITAVARLDDRDALCDALGLSPLEGAPSVPRRVWREALADVAAVAQQEGLQVFHEPSNATQIVAQLREDLATPQLIHDAAEIPVQRRAVAHGVRALLSGWGGDEGVSHFGQGRNAALLLSGRWREFAALMRSAGVTSPYRAAADTLFVHFPYIDPRPFMRRLGMLSHGKPVMSREQFTNPAFARKTRPLADQSILRVGVRRSQLRKLQFGGLAMRMEGWAASGARRGLEYRYPLLDRRLLEFALGLPPEQFKRPEAKRWLMRHALSPRQPRPHFGTPVLPPQVCWHQNKDLPAVVRDPDEPPDERLIQALTSIRGELPAAFPVSKRGNERNGFAGRQL